MINITKTIEPNNLYPRSQCTYLKKPILLIFILNFHK